MLRITIGLLTLAVIATVTFFGLDTRTGRLSAADGFAGPCNGQFAVTFNEGLHPELWEKSALDITIEGDSFQLDGPSPIISVAGTIDANGAIEAFGEGTYAKIMVFVTFQGVLTGSDPKQPDLLEGQYIVGAKGELPGEVPINYALDCPVKPPPDKTYTITVLKQHADTKAGLPGWKMNLYSGSECEGDALSSEVTDSNGLANFDGLAAGSYSVEEKMQAGWNNITPLCQGTSVPNTSGSSVAGDPNACPIQPDEPFPEPGCDEFNSVASVNVEFINPPGVQIHCALSGPTQITRSAVADGALDSIQTEITILDLTGTCDPGGVQVTVRLSSDTPSTGKITEQQNDEPGVLEFKANSFFDIYFEVNVGGTILHNQEPLRLECKIQGIPPYGCFYEPDVGNVTLWNDDVPKKEVATLTHAAHIPLDPKQKLLIFTNEPKPPTPSPTPGDDTPTPTPTLNPDFQEKIDVCIDAQVIANPGAVPIWTKAQIDALVAGADDIWGRANINITWNNNITDIDDPNPPPDGPGVQGDIIDTFKSDDEFNSLGDNANSDGKEKCVRIFFIRNFVDNDGTQYESSDGDVTLAEADGKGRGHYIVVSLKAKDNSQAFAHELGHIFGLQHNDPDKDDNLMNSFKEPGATQLNKDQMRTAREGAAAISAQDPGDVTPTPADETATATPTITKTPQPQRTRHATLRCVRASAAQKVTGSVTVTEKKLDQDPRVVFSASCDSNTNPVVRASYSISAGATKNVRLEVTVDTRNNACPFTGFAPTQRVSVSCTASPEGLEFVDTESEAGDGDANKDGTVNSIDAALILQFIAGLTGEWPNSDTNGDGTSNAIDVALILQFTAGFLTGLPT